MRRKRGLGGGGGEPSAWVISVIWCCRHLLAAALQKLAPVKALAIDVDESRCGRSHRHCKRSVRLSVWPACDRPGLCRFCLRPERIFIRATRSDDRNEEGDLAGNGDLVAHPVNDGRRVPDGDVDIDARKNVAHGLVMNVGGAEKRIRSPVVYREA